MGFIETLRSKYEIYRLEQRYARRDKRKTFSSAATYVDGEYIFIKSPTSPTTSNTSWASSNASRSSVPWSGKRSASIRVKEMMSKSTRD